MSVYTASLAVWRTGQRTGQRTGRWTALVAAAVAAEPLAAQPGTVTDEQKISSTAGGFAGPLADGDRFGSAAAALGDLDGDLVGDIVIGSSHDNDGGPDRGAVWVLFLNADGTVKAEQRISRNSGGCGCVMFDGDTFGTSVTALGDLDGDSVTDIAVGMPGDDEGGESTGSVYILFLNTDGTVRDNQLINVNTGGFTGPLAEFDAFGWSLGGLGDLDGDNVQDLAVGAIGDDDGGAAAGAVWILLLNDDGTVKADQKISAIEGGFTGTLLASDFFGSALAGIGDLDGDQVGDLAVGAMGDDGVGAFPTARGAVWVLFMNDDGTVKDHLKIGEGEGGFAGPLDDLDWFGVSLAALPDLDGSGAGELAVGALRDADGGPGTGALWVLFLNADGTVAAEQKISATEGNLSGPLEPGVEFGRSVAMIEDLVADAPVRVAVGAWEDDDGGAGDCLLLGACDRGSVWVITLAGQGVCPWDCGEPGDGVVGTADVLALLGQWGAPGACDLDGSGSVDTADLLKLLGNWGPCG